MLVMHGLGMSADSWFLSPIYGEPMPIALYEAGYDVWVGNNRGTHHSMEHVKFTPENHPERFWRTNGGYVDVAQDLVETVEPRLTMLVTPVV